MNQRSSEIEIGIGDHEKMAAVKRMFKCQSSEVMTIKTEERTYYLIGTDSKDIEEWANDLFAACKEKETIPWQIMNQAPIQTRPRIRPQSSPPNLNESVSKEYLHEGNEYERRLPSNHGVCEEETKGKSEKEEEEENEQPYYVTPRSVLVELDHGIAECDIPVENLNPNDASGDQSRVYMSMKNLAIEPKIQPVRTSVELVTCPISQKNSTDLKGDMGSQQLIGSSTGNKEPPPEKTAKHLTVVQLSRLLSSTAKVQ
ncbi:UNVERIFIED_CONTAM: hypothetical protein K2H54_044525 [Gekko kuhli]